MILNGKYLSILNESNLSLTEEQQNIIIQQFLDYLKNKPDKDSIELTIIKILDLLHSKQRFKLQLIDREDPTNKDLMRAFGYYSAYENNLYIVLDKSNFIGSGYNKLQNKDLSIFLETCIHEVLHYISTNYYINYIAIWDPTFRSFIWRVLVNIIELYYEDFVEDDDISKDAFLSDPRFGYAYKAYYNCILINLRFRYKSLIKRYNDCLSTLYSKQSFEYARFFDNVLINTIKLQQADFSDCAVKLYRCIQKAYIDLEPALANHVNSELFYQELLDFSEISCIFANHYKLSSKFTKLIQDTLNLVKV